MRIGLAQCAPVLGDVTGNRDRCLRYLAEGRDAGCDLVAFPECALSGYMFGDADSARAAAVPVAGDVVRSLLEACRRLRLHCVTGVLVTDGGVLWNSSLLLGPEGLIGRYDKAHIPRLGVDRFVTAGQRPFQVHHTALGPIGMQICYDWRFPEVTRSLALGGADLVVMPTCSPSSAGELADYLPRARALENAVFFAMTNRVGAEGGATFAGRSQVVDPGGHRLADCGDREELVTADIDVEQARRKNREQGDGLYELQIMNDRRPDLYRV